MLGELYEARGDSVRAVAHYRSLLDQWNQADPEVQPIVRDIRARTSRLLATKE